MELKLAHKKKQNKKKTTLVAHRPTAVETVSRFRSIDRLKGSHYQLLTVWKFFQVSGSWEKWEREKAVYRSPEISFQLVFKPKLKLVPLSKQSVLKSQPWTENSIEVPDIPLIIGYICTHTHTHMHTHTHTHTHAHTHTHIAPNTHALYNIRTCLQKTAEIGHFMIRMFHRETYRPKDIWESDRRYFRSGQGLFERSSTNTSDLNRPNKWNYT